MDGGWRESYGADLVVRRKEGRRGKELEAEHRIDLKGDEERNFRYCCAIPVMDWRL